MKTKIIIALLAGVGVGYLISYHTHKVKPLKETEEKSGFEGVYEAPVINGKKVEEAITPFKKDGQWHTI